MLCMVYGVFALGDPKNKHIQCSLVVRQITYSQEQYPPIVDVALTVETYRFKFDL